MNRLSHIVEKADSRSRINKKRTRRCVKNISQMYIIGAFPGWDGFIMFIRAVPLPHEATTLTGSWLGFIRMSLR